MALNYGLMKQVNGKMFKEYSNGGYMKKPIILDDSVSTDEVSARIMNYPSMKAKQTYYHPNSNYYKLQSNRLSTGFASVPSLQDKGISIVGMDQYGKINTLAVQPNTAFIASQTDSQTSWLLGAIVITGLVILVMNAVAPA